MVARSKIEPFSDNEQDLLKTFADQAVIAIENVRLFNETKEALEQQTATAEILRVIGGELTDTQPVFDAIVKNLHSLFEGSRVGLALVKNGSLIVQATGGGPAEGYELPVDRTTGLGVCVLDGQIVHFPDLSAAAEAYPRIKQLALQWGFHSALWAPLIREGKSIGALSVLRTKAAAFSDKEVALLNTFADQAVIAIGNVRLFHEIQEKSAQLETASRHKSEFLANMSHELRTPLNAILGFSEVLAEKMFGEVNDKQLDYLKDIHSSGEHLLSLINDILDLSKIEAGKMELQLSEFHLPSVLQTAVMLLKERAEHHGIQIRLEVAPDLGNICADERKLKQIMLNLLSNAVKFTPDGGFIKIGAVQKETLLEVSVSDSGAGIAEEDHAAVFEEFRQVGNNAARKAEGTGLGLPLTKRFVELHGGQIRLESMLGKGSSFIFTIPCQQ